MTGNRRFEDCKRVLPVSLTLFGLRDIGFHYELIFTAFFYVTRHENVLK